MKEQLFILKYDGGEYYIGESRELVRLNGDILSVKVGDYCVVNDLEKALPFSERQAKHLLKSVYNSEEYQKYHGVLFALRYNGGENLD